MLISSRCNEVSIQNFYSGNFLFTFSSAVFPQAELYELQSINFSGNNAFSAGELKGVIYSEETPWWFWKFLNSFTSLGAGPVYFDSTYIDVDIDALRQYYNANGYFNTTFSADFEVDTSAREVHLTYYIIEGNPSNYRNFTYYGIDNLPDVIKDNFTGELYEDSTEVYNQEVVQSNIGEGISILQNNGYMFARFDSTIIYRDTSGYYADAHLYFTTGKRFRIDTVIVEKDGPGAPFIAERLLRELTGISSGEYYNLEKIRMSQVRLIQDRLIQLC
jgi:outer membrane protein insertion porin family